MLTRKQWDFLGSPGGKPVAMRVLGIMSGTSLDGVDYVLCEVSEENVRLVQHWQARFPDRLRRELLAAAEGRSGSHDVGRLHHRIGRYYARHAGRGGGFDLVGLHGQTVFHSPGGRDPGTLQIGEPAWLAAEHGVPVVFNFRAADLTAGGQGAPLVPAFHRMLFARTGSHVCVNNLGGIANVTSLDWRDRRKPLPAVLAFDTGPANALIDRAAAKISSGRFKMDRNGAGARQGTVHESVLAEWMRHPYFKRRPPKSTGIEEFGGDLLEQLQRVSGLNGNDLLATLTEWTACSIAESYRRFLPAFPDEVVLCGGGAANAFLRERIFARLNASECRVGGSLEIVTAEDYGWPSQALEAGAFAWLAWRRWWGMNGNVPRATGARQSVPLGQICLP